MRPRKVIETTERQKASRWIARFTINEGHQRLSPPSPIAGVCDDGNHPPVTRAVTQTP